MLTPRQVRYQYHSQVFIGHDLFQSNPIQLQRIYAWGLVHFSSDQHKFAFIVVEGKLSCDHVDTQSILLCKSMKSEGEVMVL